MPNTESVSSEFSDDLVQQATDFLESSEEHVATNALSLLNSVSQEYMEANSITEKLNGDVLLEITVALFDQAAKRQDCETICTVFSNCISTIDQNILYKQPNGVENYALITLKSALTYLTPHFQYQLVIKQFDTALEDFPQLPALKKCTDVLKRHFSDDLTHQSEPIAYELWLAFIELEENTSDEDSSVKVKISELKGVLFEAGLLPPTQIDDLTTHSDLIRETATSDLFEHIIQLQRSCSLDDNPFLKKHLKTLVQFATLYYLKAEEFPTKILFDQLEDHCYTTSEYTDHDMLEKLLETLDVADETDRESKVEHVFKYISLADTERSIIKNHDTRLFAPLLYHPQVNHPAVDEAAQNVMYIIMAKRTDQSLLSAMRTLLHKSQSLLKGETEPEATNTTFAHILNIIIKYHNIGLLDTSTIELLQDMIGSSDSEVSSASETVIAIMTETTDNYLLSAMRTLLQQSLSLSKEGDTNTPFAHVLNAIITYHRLGMLNTTIITQLKNTIQSEFNSQNHPLPHLSDTEKKQCKALECPPREEPRTQSLYAPGIVPMVLHGQRSTPQVPLEGMVYAAFKDQPLIYWHCINKLKFLKTRHKDQLSDRIASLKTYGCLSAFDELTRYHQQKERRGFSTEEESKRHAARERVIHAGAIGIVDYLVTGESEKLSTPIQTQKESVIEDTQNHRNTGLLWSFYRAVSAFLRAMGPQPYKIARTTTQKRIDTLQATADSAPVALAQ